MLDLEPTIFFESQKAAQKFLFINRRSAAANKVTTVTETTTTTTCTAAPTSNGLDFEDNPELWEGTVVRSIGGLTTFSYGPHYDPTNALSTDFY
ncbi:hypothetical protein Dda_7432 [Drechslerella dactyloides]|uniref:Uncharacterized protein n=1 Tax=Drechslerella dactyloides TaxID=74499 RepID=A0AAD6IS71_DREDA|nr:hypothetical protein Dda_7432 [Drechslerella dactyloides]